MTVWWKFGTGVLLLAISFSAGWVANGWRLESLRQTEKAEVVQANADHFADASRKVNESARVYQSNSGQMKSQIAVLKKELNDVQKTNPVPVDCRPDFERMRVIKDAVRAANTAAGQ